jgi:site-specific DNA recombinase
VIEITEDTDVSGAVPATQRPQLGPWLTDPALAQRWDILCVAKLDRVTRSVADLCALIDFCQLQGKVLVSIAESFDLGTPAGRMVAAILASVAAFERERIAERRREAASFLRKNARYGGGVVPYGYQPVELPGGGWELVPDEAEAEVLRWAAGQVIGGRSLMSLADELTQRGVVTSRGKTVWRDTSLSKILHSPMLLGQIPHSGGLVRDDDGLVVRREPILTDETWARLQAALARSGKPRSSARSSAMIGVLFCPLCQGPFYVQRRTDRPTSYYRCRNATREKNCGARMIPVGAIEELIIDGLLQQCGDVMMAYEVPRPAVDHTAELQAVEEALQHMEDQLVGTQVSPEIWGRAVARLEKRQAELQAEIEALPARPESDWVETGRTFGQTLAELDEQGCRALLVANGIRVRAERLSGPGEEDVSILVGLSGPRDDGRLTLPTDAEDRSDVLILRHGDLEATVQLGNLYRLRQRLAKLAP